MYSMRTVKKDWRRQKRIFFILPSSTKDTRQSCNFAECPKYYIRQIIILSSLFNEHLANTNGRLNGRTAAACALLQKESVGAGKNLFLGTGTTPAPAFRI